MKSCLIVTGRKEVSDRNPLNLVQHDLFVAAVVELRGARRLVRRDLLGMPERAAVLDVRSDPGGVEAVAAHRRREAGVGCAALGHAKDVGAGHGLAGERARLAAGGAEEQCVLLVTNAGGRDVGRCQGCRD
jgi:hypothetical protein